MKLLTRNLLPMQNSKLDLNGILRGFFHFIGLFCYKALAVNAETTCKKRCLKVVIIKCQR